MTDAADAGAREAIRAGAADLPACLGDLSHPPAALWLLGDRRLLDAAPDRLVAIVGTREASEYGERTAAKLAAACVGRGIGIVSGLARGVDAAAHRAALETGGGTIAVMGTGVDVPYPAGHRTLHRAVASRGLVVSEYPPATTAKPGCFPRRNRLIAALARVTVVVEAGFKSGAMNTASHALDIGRTVAAVPGRMGDPRAEGTNLLIRDGAQPLTSVDDLLSLFYLSTSAVGADHESGRPQDAQRPLPCWSDTVLRRAILAALDAGGQSIDDLAFSLMMPIRQVAREIAGLELDGLVVREGEVLRLPGEF